jgi:chitin synthase
MDDFTWGNTRLVIGEGGNKKVLMNEDEKFDESMIPLKKFSGMSMVAVCWKTLMLIGCEEYEAEAWDMGSHHSDETHQTGHSSKPRSRRPPPSRPESPRSYHQASQSGDYYRDTNVTYNNSSNPNLRLGGSQLSHSNLSHQTLPQAMPPMSQYGVPQLPLMPFAGGPGSQIGSDHGLGPQIPMAMAPMSFPQANSMYGMMPGGPRNTMMTGMNMLSSGASQSGSVQGAPILPFAAAQRPMSTFSMATSVGAFAGPSMNPNPSDDELFNALRTYLSTQDLMTITKKCVLTVLSFSSIADRVNAGPLARR